MQKMHRKVAAVLAVVGALVLGPMAGSASAVELSAITDLLSSLALPF